MQLRGPFSKGRQESLWTAGGLLGLSGGRLARNSANSGDVGGMKRSGMKSRGRGKYFPSRWMACEAGQISQPASGYVSPVLGSVKVSGELAGTPRRVEAGGKMRSVSLKTAVV